jgi:hypothetical protein
VSQRTLSAEQVEAFHHDLFVSAQTREFLEMLPGRGNGGWVVDVGGGCGFFARRLSQLAGRSVRVIDLDPASVRACAEAGVRAELGDALHPGIDGTEEVATFNLILHHLVAGSEHETRALQVKALRAWFGKAQTVFVNEYIYESFVGGIAPRFIFWVTKSRLLSAFGRLVSNIVPAFRANTFGVGVRFRGHDEWVSLFQEAGYRVVDKRLGESEVVALPLRLLLIRTIRRDSFVLRPSEH